MTWIPIACEICDRYFDGMLTASHLKTHGLTQREYLAVGCEIYSTDYKFWRSAKSREVSQQMAPRLSESRSKFLIRLNKEILPKNDSWRRGLREHLSRVSTLETRRKGQQAMLAAETTEKLHSRMRNVMKANSGKGMNALEKQAALILAWQFSGVHFQFVGDFGLFIAGKCPDFVNFGQRKIIEVWGDYWHAGQNPQDRIEHFRRENWECLVVWEHEFYQDYGLLINKFEGYING